MVCRRAPRVLLFPLRETMTDFPERRRAARVSIPGRPGARTQVTLEIRVVDLSVTGGRIEHLVLLRPGSSVSVELPTAMKPQALVARVVWSKVMGGEQTPEGERHLHYQSGLAFTGLTADETLLLASSPAHLTDSGGGHASL